jgi:hypothetical protein
MPAIYNAYRGCHTPATHRAIVRAPVEPEIISAAAINGQNGGGKRFTPLEDEALLRLRREGLSWKRLGVRIGRPPNSCICRHRVLVAES